MEFFSPWKMFVGCWVPNWLCRMPDVSPGAKLCYARLAQYAGRNGKAFPKQETMSGELGVTDRQIRTYLAELLDRNLIAVISRPGMGRPNVYGFVWHEWMAESEEDGTSELYDPVAPLRSPEGSFQVERKDTSGQAEGCFRPERKDPSVNKRVIEKSPEREPGTMAASPPHADHPELGEGSEGGIIESGEEIRDRGDPRQVLGNPAPAAAPRQRPGLADLRAVEQTSIAATNQAAVDAAIARQRRKATAAAAGEIQLTGTDTTGPKKRRQPFQSGTVKAPAQVRNRRRTQEAVAAEAWWEVEAKEAFPGMILAPWGEREDAQSRMLLSRYGEELVKRGFEYVHANWASIRDRYRLQGFPTIGLLVSQHPGTSLWGEVQAGGPVGPSEKTGRMKGEHDAKAAAEAPSVGWGDEGGEG